MVARVPVPWRARVRIVWPATARMSVVVVVAAVVAHFGGAATGLWVAVLCFAALLGLHLYFLARLGEWLQHPTLETLPDGLGAWSEVFTGLYRTHRKSERNERRLADNEERFRRTISALPDGILLIDALFQIEWCNPVAERHLSLRLAADQGLRLTNLVRDPEFVAFLTSGSFDQPLVFRPLATAHVVLSVNVIAFEPARSIVITRDVTQRERVDQVRRDFVANVSHELRTPLTVVAGFIETLGDAEPPLDPLRRRHLDLMQEQAARMQRLIEDLLTLSNLESSARAEPDEAVDAGQLVREVADEARALSHGRHLVEVEFDPGAVLGVRDELRSAVGNLISNAVRYTPQGGTITLRFRREGDGGRFEVEDTGIGVAAEHIPRLTERFYRVDKSRSRETGGTGLGLAIVKHVVMRHDGQLDIRSEVGRGSLFTLRLPPARMVYSSAVPERLRAA